MFTCMIFGGSRLSVAMSEKLRCTDGSYECKFGIVISPARRKLKKHSMKAAHIIMLLNSDG